MATLGDNLRTARERAGLTQREAADRAGVTPQAISGWERGANVPRDSNIESLAAVYGTSPMELRYGQATVVTPGHLTVHERAAEPFAPNPRYRKRLPPRAYQRVYDYLAQMEGAGATHEQLDEAERVMIDGAYNKLNTRDVRDRTEDELIVDIDAAWVFIRDVLRNSGMKLK